MQDARTTATPDGRRLSLPPRKPSLRQRILAALAIPACIGMLIAMIVYTGPVLLSDWRIQSSAQPVDNARLTKGSCTTNVLFAICDLTLQRATPAGPLTRSVNYAFIDLGFGSYHARVMADPAHPELMTTDLGLDRLWDRTISFIAGLILFSGMAMMLIVARLRKVRTARRHASADGATSSGT